MIVPDIIGEISKYSSDRTSFNLSLLNKRCYDAVNSEEYWKLKINKYIEKNGGIFDLSKIPYKTKYILLVLYKITCIKKWYIRLDSISPIRKNLDDRYIKEFIILLDDLGFLTYKSSMIVQCGTTVIKIDDYDKKCEYLGSGNLFYVLVNNYIEHDRIDIVLYLFDIIVAKNKDIYKSDIIPIILNKLIYCRLWHCKKLIHFDFAKMSHSGAMYISSNDKHTPMYIGEIFVKYLDDCNEYLINGGILEFKDYIIPGIIRDNEVKTWYKKRLPILIEEIRNDYLDKIKYLDE